MGLLGCTFFLWPFFIVALAQPHDTIKQAVSDGALVLLIAMWLACLLGANYRAVQDVIRQRGFQLGSNSRFVAKGSVIKYLIRLDGDVAERLKAAVC